MIFHLISQSAYAIEVKYFKEKDKTKNETIIVEGDVFVPPFSKIGRFPKKLYFDNGISYLIQTLAIFSIFFP